MRSNSLYEITGNCHYYLAFAPRTRAIGPYRIFRQEMEAILQRLCREAEAEILLLETGSNYVYMKLSISPWRSPAETVRYLKGASSTELFQRYSVLSYMLSDRIFWANGCFLNTKAPSKRKIQDYIDKQLRGDWDEECTCTGDSV